MYQGWYPNDGMTTGFDRARSATSAQSGFGGAIDDHPADALVLDGGEDCVAVGSKPLILEMIMRVVKGQRHGERCYHEQGKKCRSFC